MTRAVAMVIDGIKDTYGICFKSKYPFTPEMPLYMSFQWWTIALIFDHAWLVVWVYVKEDIDVGDIREMEDQ